MSNIRKKWALLGASRGLGWSTYQELLKREPQSEFLLCSRRIERRLSDLDSSRTAIEPCDFSKQLEPDFFISLKKASPTHIVYFAGGGPYDLYQKKKWADHLWCWQTSFLTPAQLIHEVLQSVDSWPTLQSLTVIGSAVAGQSPDPKAASYAAAKHALHGLIGSINAEQEVQPKVLLFSPGYMQTELLPAHSEPRLTNRAESPDIVAQQLIEYIENSLK